MSDWFNTSDLGGGDPSPGYSTTDLVGTAQQIGADTSYDVPAVSSGTYPGQDTQSSDSAGDSWGWLKGLATTAVDYAITKDAVASGLTGPRANAPVGAPAGNAQASVQPRKSMSPLVLLLLGGVVVYVAVRAAK
jgi:hypothetical protein